MRESELIDVVKKEVEAGYPRMIEIGQKIRVALARLEEKKAIEMVLLPGPECTKDWYYRMK